MRSNFLLILGLCVGSLQQTVLGAVCYEKDKAPVELDVVSDIDCVDLEGNIYSPGSELLSCCDCFRLETLNYQVTRKLTHNSDTNVRRLTAGRTI